MIKLLPRTARHYDPPREPNQVDVYIDVDDETVKQSLTDIESFEGLTSLSNRILWHLVRNYFADIRQEIPYQWFTINQDLHKQLTHFLDNLIPEKSVISFQNCDYYQNYTYQGQKNGQLIFKQYYYDTDDSPTVMLYISI